VHLTLNIVLKKKLPQAENELKEVLKDCFPRDICKSGEMRNFIDNLFFICRYLPHFQEFIFDLVLNKILKLEV
jgi:hypothetical protein